MTFKVFHKEENPLNCSVDNIWSSGSELEGSKRCSQLLVSNFLNKILRSKFNIIRSFCLMMIKSQQTEKTDFSFLCNWHSMAAFTAVGLTNGL